jgi:hypothetical protein
MFPIIAEINRLFGKVYRGDGWKKPAVTGNGKQLDVLRGRTIGVGLTLRQIVQEPGAGALPRAAAHAAEGLQLLLGICAAAPDIDTKTLLASDALADELYGARDALQYAIINLDKVLDPYIAARRMPRRPKYPF